MPVDVPASKSDEFNRGYESGYRDAQAASRATVARLTTALERIVDQDSGGRGCSTFTRPPWCRDEGSGRRLDGVYGAESWCDSCVARAALDATTAPEPARTPLRTTRHDIARVLESIIEEGETTEAYKRAGCQLVELLDADPREAIFRGHVADWENPSPDSGDWPKAVLDGEWLTDPAKTPGTEVAVYTTGPAPRQDQP